MQMCGRRTAIVSCYRHRPPVIQKLPAHAKRLGEAWILSIHESWALACWLHRYIIHLHITCMLRCGTFEFIRPDKKDRPPSAPRLMLFRTMLY